MRAFGYARVSTAGQAHDGVSLDAQRARIQAWCDANGYELADVFVDAGVSGSRAANRAGLQKALQQIRRARGGALVVYSLSRLARSTKDAIDIAERLDKGGADLVSLSERLDTTSASGKMVFRMLAVLAEFERDLASERTRAALHLKRARGQRLGGALPYGYDVEPDGVTLVEIPAEQVVITDIVAMRARGMTLPKIARALTEGGVLTKQGNHRWGHQVIGKILRRHSKGYNSNGAKNYEQEKNAGDD